MLLALAIGCGTTSSNSAICDPPGVLPSCDVADACLTDDTGTRRADCVEATSWSADCAADWRASDSGTSEEGLIYAGDLGFVPYSHAASYTITDEATWEEFVAGWYDAPTLPSVDFDSNIVVIAQYLVNSTCGMSMTRHGVWVPTGGDGYPVEVYVEWADSTGSCNEVCDMEARSGVIYQTPRSRGWPSVCSTVINSCDS
jgi:hypothetical protein